MPCFELDECDLAELCQVLPDRLLKSITDALNANFALVCRGFPQISVSNHAGAPFGASLRIKYTDLPSQAEAKAKAKITSKLVWDVVDSWYDVGTLRGTYISETMHFYDLRAASGSVTCLFRLELPTQS